jgi:CRP-like cAMP-binding protein
MNLNIDQYHLKSHSFYDFLNEDEKEFVNRSSRRLEFKEKQVLFREGSHSKGVYIVKKGKVKIFKSNPDGKESIVYIYKKGDYFGYRPLLANEPHPASAVAIDNVVVTFVPVSIFNELIERSPAFTKKLLTGLSREFSVWINKVSVFSHHTVKERVALSLLILDRVYKRDNNKVTTISLNRDDFAGYVGTAKETLVRMLRVFKDEKIIETRSTKITVLRPKALEKFLGNY